MQCLKGEEKISWKTEHGERALQKGANWGNLKLWLCIFMSQSKSQSLNKHPLVSIHCQFSSCWSQRHSYTHTYTHTTNILNRAAVGKEMHRKKVQKIHKAWPEWVIDRVHSCYLSPQSDTSEHYMIVYRIILITIAASPLGSYSKSRLIPPNCVRGCFNLQSLQLILWTQDRAITTGCELD